MPLFSQVLQYKTKKLHSCNNSLNICPQMTATTLLGGSSSLLRTQAPVRGQKKRTKWNLLTIFQKGVEVYAMNRELPIWGTTANLTLK